MSQRTSRYSLRSECRDHGKCNCRNTPGLQDRPRRRSNGNSWKSDSKESETFFPKVSSSLDGESIITQDDSQTSSSGYSFISDNKYFRVVSSCVSALFNDSDYFTKNVTPDNINSSTSSSVNDECSFSTKENFSESFHSEERKLRSILVTTSSKSRRLRNGGPKNVTFGGVPPNATSTPLSRFQEGNKEHYEESAVQEQESLETFSSDESKSEEICETGVKVVASGNSEENRWFSWNWMEVMEAVRQALSGLFKSKLFFPIYWLLVQCVVVEKWVLERGPLSGRGSRDIAGGGKRRGLGSTNTRVNTTLFRETDADINMTSSRRRMMRSEEVFSEDDEGMSSGQVQQGYQYQQYSSLGHGNGIKNGRIPNNVPLSKPPAVFQGNGHAHQYSSTPTAAAYYPGPGVSYYRDSLGVRQQSSTATTQYGSRWNIVRLPAGVWTFVDWGKDVIALAWNSKDSTARGASSTAPVRPMYEEASSSSDEEQNESQKTTTLLNNHRWSSTHVTRRGGGREEDRLGGINRRPFEEGDNEWLSAGFLNNLKTFLKCLVLLFAITLFILLAYWLSTLFPTDAIMSLVNNITYATFTLPFSSPANTMTMPMPPSSHITVTEKPDNDEFYRYVRMKLDEITRTLERHEGRLSSQDESTRELKEEVRSLQNALVIIQTREYRPSSEIVQEVMKRTLGFTNDGREVTLENFIAIVNGENIRDEKRSEELSQLIAQKYEELLSKTKDLSNQIQTAEKDIRVVEDKVAATPPSSPTEVNYDALRESIIPVLKEEIAAQVKVACNNCPEPEISPGPGSGVDITEVNKLIDIAISKYDSDKTGLPDLALESAGGSILSTRCTKSSNIRKSVVSIWGIPLWSPPNNPRTIIQPGVVPGECWAFEGSIGDVVIKLVSPSVVTGFTMEHIPKSVSPYGSIDSAPAEFKVLGMVSETEEEPHDYGTFTYDDNEKPLQYFDVINRTDIAFPIVELKILSNHGNLRHTCLYRFRVHGTLHNSQGSSFTATVQTEPSEESS